ncbi:MAG: 23S rRNA (adenine(2503)-C(2))-methyltransferase RlmN [bacterium]|nr:23S rRNA (adenine(2503)-C(2))-methyltransferase RlmN [bacterium]
MDTKDTTDLISLNREELRKLFAELEEPAFRADQLFEWVHRKHIRDFSAMTNLSLSLRERLAAGYRVSPLEIRRALEAPDGTRKYVFVLADEETIEAVFLPEPDYFSLCVSSQAGCPLACAFCATGGRGFRRNLTAAEILGQIHLILAERAAADRLGNVLFMGMGEPLLNVSELRRVLSLLSDPRGLALSPRKIVVSTSGVVPELLALAEETNVRFAISLNAPNPAIRKKLMPGAETKYPLPALIQALRKFPRNYPGRLMIEYVLVRGVNDSEASAAELEKLLRGIKARVNLIAHNPFPGSGLTAPEKSRVLRFQEVLISAGRNVFIREPRGAEIQAACGQLAAVLK